MKLSIIKTLHRFSHEHDEDFLHETSEVLEEVAMSKGVSEEEMAVIGELLSNLSGAIEVNRMVADGQSEREALNGFMQRVLGSIDR